VSDDLWFKRFVEEACVIPISILDKPDALLDYKLDEDWSNNIWPGHPDGLWRHRVDRRLMAALSRVVTIAGVPEEEQFFCHGRLLCSVYRAMRVTTYKTRGRPQSSGKYPRFENLVRNLFRDTWQYGGHLTFSDNDRNGKSEIGLAVTTILYALAPSVPREWFPPSWPPHTVAKIRDELIEVGERYFRKLRPGEDWLQFRAKRDQLKSAKAMRRKLRRSGIHTG
jgi:hypothetical protein